MTNAKLTQDELQAIKERAEEIEIIGTLYAKGDPWKGYEIRDEKSGQVYAETSGGVEADFFANARQDIPKLVAEVERLQKAIDNAISLLPDGENRLANRYLCEALGVDEDHYGFFSGGDDD